MAGLWYQVVAAKNDNGCRVIALGMTEGENLMCQLLVITPVFDRHLANAKIVDGVV